MPIQRTPPQSSTQSTNIADLLERILDKGVVIAGDIRVSLVNVELLTIQIRLVICSVDKAKEMGMDWWVNNPAFGRHPERPALADSQAVEDRLERIMDRLERIEASLPNPQPDSPSPDSSQSEPEESR